MKKKVLKEGSIDGRPPKYGPDILKKAQEFLDMCEDTEEQQLSGLSVKGTELYKNKLKVKIPTKGGLAFYLGVARDTLFDWAEKNKDFSDIMEKLGAIQEERLINNGLSGDYNPTIAKVLLTKHGYREGLEQSGPGGQDLFKSTEAEKEAIFKAMLFL
jgi:hypothetical protein